MMTKKKVNESENHEEKTNTHASENNINNKPVTDNNEALKELPSEESPAVQAEGETAAIARESDKVADDLKNMEEKLAEMQDKYLRLSAEFDNYRKRTLKEKMEISRYAGEELLKGMLPIADDFDRAMRHMEGSTDCKGLKEGIDLISCKFTEFLRQNGIKEIESLNSEFNVDLHDAVAKVQVTDENQKGRVVEILQKGYYLKDKVIRHSKVVVGE
jgi:molecular chaperone GrpE